MDTKAVIEKLRQKIMIARKCEEDCFNELNGQPSNDVLSGQDKHTIRQLKTVYQEDAEFYEYLLNLAENA
jgi:hypothetical protein